MNKFLFYLLAFTWGLPMTIIGLLVALVLVIAGFKPKKYGNCLHFEVGDRWGGVSLGIVFITSKNASEHTKMHEHGHAIQNCYWGVLFPFVIALPSLIRCWHRDIQYVNKGKPVPTPYDSIWFEGDASKRGYKFFGKLGEEK